MATQHGARTSGPLTALAVLLLLAAGAPRDARAADVALRCQTTKLTAAVAEARTLLACARSGASPTCAAGARARRDAAFVRAEARGGCTTTADSDAIGALDAALVASVTALLQPGGPAASGCTSAQLAASGRAASALGRSHARNERDPDPPRLAADVARASQTFTAAFARAVARGGCPGTATAAQAFAAVAGGVEDVVAALFPEVVACPCWTTAELDTTLPPGFFDLNGRGGLVCDAPGSTTSFGAADTCTIFGPMGMTYVFPRGGVGMFPPSACIVFPDLDPDDDGTCNGPPSVIENGLTPAETAACIATLQGAQAYGACP